MRILALDAAGERCGAALFEGEACLARFAGGDSRVATAALPQAVAQMFEAHGRGLDAVAVTVGPGSFTGLRGAIAFAQGVGLAAGAPVIGVAVAEALLEGVRRDGPVWVALDARREGRVFLDPGTGMAVFELDALPPVGAPVLVFGDAAALVCGRLGMDARDGGVGAVSAEAVCAVATRRLRGVLPPLAAQPLYLGPPSVRVPAAG